MACAAGQKLTFTREGKEKTESGYEVRKRHYRKEVHLAQNARVKLHGSKSAETGKSKAI